ncbi:MAG: hypothetical protein ACE366_25340 [Bradymonadia bacterium]
MTEALPPSLSSGDIPLVHLHGRSVIMALAELCGGRGTPDPRVVARLIQSAQMIERDGPVRVMVHLRLPRINEQALWLTAEDIEVLSPLFERLEARQAGGWSIPPHLTMEAVRDHFTALVTGEPLPEGPHHMRLLPRRHLPGEIQAPRGAQAIWAFSQAVAETARVLNRRPIDLRRARRVVALLRDVLEIEGDFMTALLLKPPPGPSVSRRAVETAALTLKFARALSLPSETVNALGLSALLHPAGQAWVDDIPKGLFDAAELRHTLALAQLWSQSRWTPSLMRRVSTAVEHALGPAGRGAPRLGGAPPPLHCSRLLALISLWLELVQGSTFADPVTPFEAGLTLLRRPPAHLGGVLVNTFIATVGLMPVGAMMALGNHHLGVVVGIDGSPLQPQGLSTRVRVIDTRHQPEPDEILVCEGAWGHEHRPLRRLILGPDSWRWRALVPDQAAMSRALGVPEFSAT